MKRRSREPEPTPDVPPEPAADERVRTRPRRDPVAAFFVGIAKLVFWGFVVGVALTTAGLAWLSSLASGLPETVGIGAQPARASVVILDRYGREIARRGPLAAPDVSIDELPDYLIEAVLAVEDRRFYEHGGVDLRGLARAALENVRAGRVVQGGSTLTQQLAKNLFLDNDRTLERKAREIVLAAHLERTYSKDELLELYFNRVYFGAGAWGVSAASQRYFGKPPARLTLGEAALLAGLLKAPSRYSPINDVGLAEERATVVLQVMAETGMITSDELDAALAEPVVVRATAQNDRGAGWFVDWAIAEGRTLAGEGAQSLVVHTTLDLDAQVAAERAVREGLAGVQDRGAEQAALVALDGDGAVRALVGGRSYTESQFDRAREARRQPGSAFKPFVYAAALEAGLSPWDVRPDAPITIGEWSPANFDEEFKGDIALIDALALSINTVAVRVAEEVGRERIVRLVKRLGVTSRIRATASMALGAHEVRPIDLIGAYATFANDGFVVEPYGVVRVETADGQALWRRQPPAAVRGLDPRTSRLMNVMLTRVVTDGTGRNAALPDRPSAGKTGTSNDFRDAWYIGYVPGYVAGVWVGADDSSPMQRVTGGALPTRIWRAFMLEVMAGQPVVAFETEPGPIASPAPAAAPSETSLPPSPPTGPETSPPLASQPDSAALEALLGRINGL